MMNESGQGTPINLQKAVEWYRMAAENGLAKAQGNLGRMYASGTGVEKDPVQACKWLLLGSLQKEVTASNLLDDLLRVLTPGQIAEGKRLADEFLARQTASSNQAK
jgi:hypothetical protein